MSPEKNKVLKARQRLRTFGKVIKGLLTTNTCLQRRTKSITLSCVGQAKTLQLVCNTQRSGTHAIDVGGNDYESTQLKRRPCLRIRSHPPRAAGICLLTLEVFPRAGQPVSLKLR